MSSSSSARVNRTSDTERPDQIPSTIGALGTAPDDDLAVWDYEEKSSILDEPVLYFDQMRLESSSPRDEHLGEETPARSLSKNGSGTRSISPPLQVTPPHWTSSAGESSASSLRAMSLTDGSTSSTRHVSTPPDDREFLPRRPASQLGVSVGSSHAMGRMSERNNVRVVSAPMPRSRYPEDTGRQDDDIATSKAADMARPLALSSSMRTTSTRLAHGQNDTSATIVAGDQGSRLRTATATPGFADRAQLPPSTMRRNLSRFGGPARRAAPVVEVDAEDVHASADVHISEARGTSSLGPEKADEPNSTSPVDPVPYHRSLLERAHTTASGPAQTIAPPQMSSPLRISPPPVEEPFRPFDRDSQRAAVPDSKSFRLIQSSYVAHNSNSQAPHLQTAHDVPQTHRDQSWAASRPAPYPRHPDHIVDHAPSEPSGAATVHRTVPDPLVQPPGGTQGKRTFLVNGIAYERIGVLGKGGSSRVYSVLCPNKRVVYALKRVALDRADAETYQSYTNEIELLKRLRGHDRIIQLVDDQITIGSNGRPKLLLMVMECGEIDFSTLLEEQGGRPLNLNFVGLYWEQMLEAVQAVHMENVVHTDLKPANFVLVKGRLKIIDFGIAKAIANDTVNIQRDAQMGTVNYMSPEAIQRMNNATVLKLSYPSDVWSLGCILYQMIYGVLPFGHLNGPLPKMNAIANPNHKIDYPRIATPRLPPGSTLRSEDLSVPVLPSAIDTMKRCLMYRKEQRLTIPELLRHEFLRPREASPGLPEGSTTITQQQMGLLVKYILKSNGVPIQTHHDLLISDLFSQLEAQNSLEQEQR